MQISYKLAFSYLNNSVIRTFLKIEKYKGGWIIEGLLYKHNCGNIYSCKLVQKPVTVRVEE